MRDAFFRFQKKKKVFFFLALELFGNILRKCEFFEKKLENVKLQIKLLYDAI